MHQVTITIAGPAGSGKSRIVRAIEALLCQYHISCEVRDAEDDDPRATSEWGSRLEEVAGGIEVTLVQAQTPAKGI